MSSQSVNAPPADSGTPTPKFYSFWAINGPLESGRLRKQLDGFRVAGLDGVVFHPRFYPGTPPYLSEPYFALVSEAILHARAIGLAFWLYDEDGWPSGTVGGQLLRRFPEHAQRWVGLFESPPPSPLVEFTHDGKRWYLAERRGAGVDYLDPMLCQRFIGLTHERYRDGLLAEAFAHVEAFFCDEPEFGLGHLHDNLPPGGAIPWTPRLPQLYRERFGEDLEMVLPALFFPLTGHEEARVRFWEFVGDLFCDAFIAPLDAWCRRHGKLLTAHVKGEEHPLFQVPMVGSCHQVFQRLSLPGIDALERYPSNDFHPRQVSSAARQFGDGRCMAEAFGGAGWGATPEDLERYLLWLGNHGITDFVLHLSQYRLDSAAMHDWPPSQPFHLSWSGLYAQVIDRVRGELRARPRPAADTLVVAPYRGIMSCYTPAELMETNIHDAGTYPPTQAGAINTRFLEQIDALHRAGVRYDLTDERTLERSARRADGGIRLGRVLYPRVLLAQDCRLHSETRRLVEPALARSADPIPRKASAAGLDTSSDSVLPVEWSLEEVPVNDYLLEVNAEPDGWFSAGFVSRLPEGGHPALKLFFADDIAQAEFNAAKLAVSPAADGSIAQVPDSLLKTSNIARFRAVGTVARPFVWLRGKFRLASASPFTDGPANTVKTDGPFALESARPTAAGDLVTDGFPFLRGPINAVAEVVLPGDFTALRLDGMEADAACLAVDDAELGWTWRTRGQSHFDAALPAGKRRLRLTLIPNTFNACGPHHYYGGDWFIVSPDQIKGVRNFADPADAPEHTHVAAWHFRRFSLPTGITLRK